jgi:hypothetical protein
MRKWQLLMLCASASVAGAATAHAEEMLIPTVDSGNWMAAVHKRDLNSRPDACLVMGSGPTRMLFRADSSELFLRLINPKWSLPTGVTGSISITVGSYSWSGDIHGNTSDMVDIPIAVDDLKALFVAMDKAAALQLTVGKSAASTVSLNGSSKATNAFLTCAGIKGGNASGGDNPFR